MQEQPTDAERREAQREEDRYRSEAPKPGERATAWLGLDWNQDSDVFTDLACEAAAGTDDFYANKRELDQTRSGRDKFHHCRANCEAMQRGPGGALAASAISLGKEAVNIPSKIANGKDVVETIKDSVADLRADWGGFEAGFRGERCCDACRRVEGKLLGRRVLRRASPRFGSARPHHSSGGRMCERRPRLGSGGDWLNQPGNASLIGVPFRIHCPRTLLEPGVP